MRVFTERKNLMVETALTHNMCLLKAAAFITAQKLSEQNLSTECEMVRFRYRLDIQDEINNMLCGCLDEQNLTEFFSQVNEVGEGQLGRLGVRTAREVAERFGVSVQAIFVLEEQEVKPIYRNFVAKQNCSP